MPTSAPTFRQFLARDAALALVCAVLWALPAQAVGLLAARGTLLVLCAFLLHEWGHVLGARLSAARIQTAPTLISPFIFSMDVQRNRPGQLMWVSLTGFAATGLFLLVFWLTLPIDRLDGQIAW